MRKPCSILVLCILLGFGVVLVVPAEDTAETVYDESEALPYECAPMLSVAAAVAEPPSVRPRASRFERGSVRPTVAQQVNQGRGGAYPICDSLTILDHTLRC